MIIRVDSDSALPVYEQIREQVVRMVVAGTLKPGTRIPTIRQLANDLQLAKGTIAKAYALLETGGTVESRGHRGTFIADRATTGAIGDRSTRAALADAADAYVIASRQLGAELETAVDEFRSRWDRF